MLALKVCTVKVYNGKGGFFWTKHRELKRLQESDVQKGMICAVLFTINFYSTSDKTALNMHVVQKTAGLNLQSIVVLADNPNASQDTIGTHDLPPCDDVEVDAAVTVERAINPDYDPHGAPVAEAFDGEQMA